MDDLIAFLNARLDEDEAAANAGARRVGMPWHAEPQPGAPGGLVIDELGLVASTGGRYAAEHIARHDPARVLREVAAKRAILAAYLSERENEFLGGGYCEGLEEAVKIIAATWSGHEGYQPRWAP